MGTSFFKQLFPGFGKKILWPQISPFLTFWLVLLTSLKNYTAKFEIQGLAEKKISYANLTCASGYAQLFEKI